MVKSISSYSFFMFLYNFNHLVRDRPKLAIFLYIFGKQELDGWVCCKNLLADSFESFFYLSFSNQLEVGTLKYAFDSFIDLITLLTRSSSYIDLKVTLLRSRSEKLSEVMIIEALKYCTRP